MSTVVLLFELMWAASQELPDEALPSLTEIERQILRTLYLVDKDETGVRRLNMALRTYRKYVARLIGRLDADNRFQAALRAPRARLDLRSGAQGKMISRQCPQFGHGYRRSHSFVSGRH
ncbi:hypothetical protein ACFVQ0_11375 [Streptomyces sp. NPDC057900]|uniref:hypothetical protein n=1 Tax=Streptomyces sp. NPDC057900 TaxID=3346274 RepID=UPI0036ED5974